MKNKTFLSIILILLIIIYSYPVTAYTIPVWSNLDGLAEVNADTSEDFLNIESESAILIEQTTGKVLYEKNSHKQLRPASVTKVMTILLIMEALDRGDINLDTKIPCSENASNMGGSQIWLNETETLTVDEMLKAICVVSANDCTVAMAEYLAGSEELFVQKMNERAKELGMNDTTFKNCHGIDEEGHVSSSYDIALMSKELLQNHPVITNYTTIWMDSLRDGQSELVNTNKLIRTYDGITGLKTGSTSLALYNLSASATRNELSLISVILRAPTTKLRFSEAKLLLDYGFNNYKYNKFAKKGDFIQSIDISKGVEKKVNLVFETDCGALIKKNENQNITQELIINDNINAPILEGEILGKMNFYINNELICTTNLVAEKSVEKMNFANILSYISEKWINLNREK